MNIHQVLDKEIVPRLATEFQPEAIYLFGSLIRGRLRRRYPDLSLAALNIKVIEETCLPDRRQPDYNIFGR